MVYYKQCMLQRTGKTIVWIPEKFAIQGKYLKIKIDEVWQNGWLVKEVYDTRIKEKEILDSHKKIKSHKKKTGDSDKKEKA